MTEVHYMHFTSLNKAKDRCVEAHLSFLYAFIKESVILNKLECLEYKG